MKRLIVPALAVALALGGAAWASARAWSPAVLGEADQSTLSLKAIDAIKYDKKALSARAGVVRIVMKNLSPLKHNVAVKGHGIIKKGKTVGTGSVSTVAVSLKPGKYTFYCSVPGHEAAGMKGTLIVK